MSGFADCSSDPNTNTLIGGISLAENGTPPGNVNNAIRLCFAYGRLLADTVAAIVTGMPTTGGTFTGDIIRSGAGLYRYNVDATLTSGKEYFLLEGTALPGSPAEGDVVWFYT